MKYFKIFLIILVSIIIIISIDNFDDNKRINAQLENDIDTTTQMNSQNQSYFIKFDLDKITFYPNEIIMIKGNLFNSLQKPIPNKIVIVDIYDDTNLTDRFFDVTDKNGEFEVNYEPLNQGYKKITAKLQNTNDNTATILIHIKLLVWSLIVSLLLVSTIFILLLLYIRNRNYIYFIVSIILTVIGFALVNIYPPFEDFGSTIIQGIFLIPFVTFFIGYIKEKENNNKELESTFRKKRDEILSEELNMLVKIHDEISQHASILLLQYNNSENFSDAHFKKFRRAGLIANLPTMRINVYYNHIKRYNHYSRISAGLNNKNFCINNTDNLKIDNFNKEFNKLKETFLKLNELLYILILYSIGEIQHNYISVPTVNIPIRFSLPLSISLLRSGVFGDVKKELIYKNHADITTRYFIIKNKKIFVQKTVVYEVKED